MGNVKDGSALTVAANGCDIVTVVEVVALGITVAARVSLAVVSSTASSIYSQLLHNL